jgi:hypothetical protein
VFCLCVLGASVVRSAFAAPPNATYLFPAGGQRGTTVEVVAGGTFERWPVQGRADVPGISIKPGKDKGKLKVSVAADVELGRHWIWLFDEQGVSVPQPFIVGNLPELQEQEPNDDVKSAQKLPFAAVTINGRLGKPGDVDCYSVTLQKGQTLVAAFEGWRTLRAPMDAILQIVSADGFVLAENNDYHGLDPFIAFSVPKDGTFVVRAFAFPAVPDTTIRFSGGESYVYRLTLTTGGFADYPWPLAAQRNKPATVEMVGWNILELARRVAVCTAGPTGDTQVAHPAVANTVDVRVEPHPCLVKPDNGEPFPLVPPVTVTSRLAKPRAVDQFVLKAKKAEKLTVRVESRELGLPVTAVIRIADAAGRELGRAEPGGLHDDPELSFTPPTDGDYRLTVRDLYAGGGPRFAYRLRVAKPAPDFALSVAADRLTLAAGQSLNVPVTVQRISGFSGEIVLTAANLPAGVEAKVEAGKDPAKMSLELTAKADAVGGGLFQITGRSKIDPDLRHPATAPLPNPFDGAPPVRSHHLWLTITRPAGK